MMTNLRFFSATSKFFKGRQLSICHSVFSNRSKTLYFRPTGRLIKKKCLYFDFRNINKTIICHLHEQYIRYKRKTMTLSKTKSTNSPH